MKPTAYCRGPQISLIRPRKSEALAEMTIKFVMCRWHNRTKIFPSYSICFHDHDTKSAHCHRAKSVVIEDRGLSRKARGLEGSKKYNADSRKHLARVEGRVARTIQERWVDMVS